jgi:hypothetical protein
LVLAVLASAAAACSSSGGGTTGTGGSPGSGGDNAATGGTTSTGGKVGTGGIVGTGGVVATGGIVGTGGVVATGGVVGTGGVAGSSAGGGKGGGGGAGHTGGAGGSATATGGSGPGGSSGGGECSRDFLTTTVAAYFTALTAHDPSTLPLASTVKFTENGKTSTIGSAGLWKTAGALKVAYTAYDTDGCNTASEAVVPDGSTDIPLALRLKVVNQQITEVETIAVRAGDYKVSGSNFASDTGAIIMSDSTIHWETPVTTGANTPAEMNAWMAKYFAQFPAGVCNTDSSCKRLENGGGSFSCSAGASCSTSSGTGSPVLKSHAIFSDVETGIGAGFDNFMSNCDMHFFKMYGGKVYAVHAVLGACSSTGWDDK